MSTTTAEFAAGFARDNDAELLGSSGSDVEAARAHLLQSVAIAARSGYLNVTEINHRAQYYAPVPAGAQLHVFRGAVRRGFVIRHDDDAWIGYSTAGNGTYGAVWKVSENDRSVLDAVLGAVGAAA